MLLDVLALRQSAHPLRASQLLYNAFRYLDKMTMLVRLLRKQQRKNNSRRAHINITLLARNTVFFVYDFVMCPALDVG